MDNLVLQIPGLDSLDVGTLIFARGFKQYCEMVKKIQAGECFFCQLNTDFNEVIFENKLWHGWYYTAQIESANLACHIVIAHKRHLPQLTELTSEDGRYLFEIVLMFAKKDNLSGGGLLMRFGDPRLNAGTVRHLHLNIIVPNGKGDVRLPLRKTGDEVEQNMKKALVFEKMRLGTPLNELEPTEYELVKDRMK